MKLAISFECPTCRNKSVQQLADIRPGRNRTCHNCGTPVALTASALSEFEQTLRHTLYH